VSHQHRTDPRNVTKAPARLIGGPSIEPEVTRAMGIAFDNACKSLKLVDRADPLTELVAIKIMELAAAGEHDPERRLAALDLIQLRFPNAGAAFIKGGR
jgi:hypothetical protein